MSLRLFARFTSRINCVLSIILLMLFISVANAVVLKN